MVDSIQASVNTFKTGALSDPQLEWTVLRLLCDYTLEAQGLFLQERITAAYFQGYWQRATYEVLTSMIANSVATAPARIDIIELTMKLRAFTNDDSCISVVSEKLINPAYREFIDSLPKYLKSLRLYAEKRLVIKTFSDLVNRLGDSLEAGDALRQAEEALSDILIRTDSQSNRLTRGKSTHLVGHTVDYLGSVGKQNKNTRRYPTGIGILDDVIAFGPGQTLVAAAEPGGGKTALITQAAANLALQNIPVLIVSLEMRTQELARRILANMGGLNHERLGSAYLSEVEWRRVDDVVKKRCLYILRVTTT
jgi:replicative DNA helicase